MRGSDTDHSSQDRKHLKLWAAALGAAVSLTIAGTPASAHSPNDYRTQRSHLEDRARSQTGAPYSYGGSSPSGFDCSGFTRWIFLDHGADLPHSSGAQFELGKKDGYDRIWDRKKLEVGDLVFHDTGSGGVSHVGMYVGNDKFISVTSSGGVRVRSLYDSYWGPRWVGATRVPATMEDESANTYSSGKYRLTS